MSTSNDPPRFWEGTIIPIGDPLGEVMDLLNYMLTEPVVEDLNTSFIFHPDSLTPREKDAGRLFGELYEVIHGLTPGSCYHVHESSRQRTYRRIQKLREEREKNVRT